MDLKLSQLLEESKLPYEAYRLLKASFRTDERILEAIADAGTPRLLLKRLGFIPSRVPSARRYLTG